MCRLSLRSATAARVCRFAANSRVLSRHHGQTRIPPSLQVTRGQVRSGLTPQDLTSTPCCPARRCCPLHPCCPAPMRAALHGAASSPSSPSSSCPSFPLITLIALIPLAMAGYHHTKACGKDMRGRHVAETCMTGMCMGPWAEHHDPIPQLSCG